ncbi:MAG: ParB N-terminal domain-containing protein [Spirochaetota bacterium]|jgi:ParB family chromosome partitioning protein|nr:ParB N-terminal domain-containing protein [Spirochaetota bacterium]
MRVEQIAIGDIKVSNRVREDYGDINALAASLKTSGQHVPIIVDEKNHLLAGGRRLQAAKLLGWTKIDAIIAEGLTALQKLDVEVQENLVRKDFTEAEVLKSIEMKRRLMRRPWYTAIWDFIKKIFSSFIGLFRRR